MSTEENTNIQMNMNFSVSSGNQFKENLDNARFSLFFEIRVPASDADLASAVEHQKPFEEFTSSVQDMPCALAFTDDQPLRPSFDPCTFAAALCSSGRDRHILYLSGRNRKREQISGFLEHCFVEGFRNIAAVSGISKNPPPPDFSPVESPEILKLNGERKTPLFAGCTVNPFKYEPLTIHATRSKLIKKLNAGAGFIAAQFGMDPAKIQELLWELFRAGKFIPVISRVCFLNPESAENICSGRVPGISFTKDFIAGIRKEMRFSARQFEAAQWRRFQLHAAGARYLGCSGLQINGISDASYAEKAAAKIREVFRELRNYRDWLEACRDYYSHISMTPYPEKYCLFDNLLTEEESFEKAKVHKEDFPMPSSMEFFRYNLSQFLFSGADRVSAKERRLTKKLVAGCRSCSKCRLPSCMYVCPKHCPKDLANGICGEVNQDGTCPYFKEKRTECIHLLRMRLAIYNMDFRSQEQTIVER